VRRQHSPDVYDVPLVVPITTVEAEPEEFSLALGELVGVTVEQELRDLR
jgi:hypothetical protein